jgi:thioredoxin-related protein
MVQKHFLRKTIPLFTLAILFITLPLLGQTAQPDSAQTILNTAVSNAQITHKTVLLVFHATWCGWCRRLETALNDTSVKPIIDENYIVAMVDVMEHGSKIQTHENPGGDHLLSEFGGTVAGLPFIAFLNGKGKMIANSNVMPNNVNIGYPGSEEEIAAFMKLLRRTAPHMNRKQYDVIENYLELHAPQ